jgi:hypothetical protein
MTPARLARSLAATAVVALGIAAPASAYHIPGATYEGTHSEGGRVSFTITDDGDGISSFSAYGPIQGNSCTFGSGGQPATTTYTVPLPIEDHSFSDTRGPFFKEGTFTGVQQAEGTLQVTTTGGFRCESRQLTWSATTTASPARSEECRRARSAVRRARSAVRRARTPRAKRRARARLRRAQARERANCEPR